MNRMSVLGSMIGVVLAGVALEAQELPPGVFVQTIACSLNEGSTMPAVVTWARAVPRDETAPDAIFFREAIFNPAFRENDDFTIASYYPSFEEMVARVGAAGARPANRTRPAVRASDLFTCNPSTLSLSLNRTVNPDSDVFEGPATLMSTRFCQLNEGATAADAFAFAQEVAAKFRAAGDNSLMQMYTRTLGPVGDTVAGRGVMITAVAATPEAFAARMDLPNNGLDVLEGLTPPVACDYPAMWRTNRVHDTND